MQTHDVEVLVVGQGPVGSVATLHLARNGVTVAAVEAVSVGAQDLRASTFHAPTLEMLDDLGAADELLKTGLKAPVYQYRDRQSDEIFAFDMSELSDHTRYPYRIQREQHVLVRDIDRILEREGSAEVQNGRRLLFIEPAEDHVIAYVETPTAVERYKARYVIAADGANSIARKVLGLEFPGFTYSEKFLCLSTAFPLESRFSNLSAVNYISDPTEWVVLLRVPSLWRILVPAPQSAPDDWLLSDANKDAVFERMLGEPTDVTTHHRTIYRVHQRVCETFAVGRVCLAGDAAHLNSPMGGFGMNSGIHDAVNLCEKLAAILNHGATPDLVSLYDRQRRIVTNEFVQVQTIENTRLMSEGWGAAREGRKRQMAEISRDPVLRRAYLLKQAMFTSLEHAAAIQ